MKFSTDSKELASAVAYVGSTLAPSVTPALTGIRCEVAEYGEQHWLMLSATDGRAFQRAGIRLEGDCTPGEALVSGFMLREIVSQLDAGEVTAWLVGQDARLELSMKRSRYRIPLIADAFPADPSVEAATGPGSNGWTGFIDPDVLKQMLDAVRHCVNDASLHAPGVVLFFSPEGLRIVGMSDAALSTATAPWLQTVGEPQGEHRIVSVAALTAATRGAGASTGDIQGIGLAPLGDSALGTPALFVTGNARDAHIRCNVASKALLWDKQLAAYVGSGEIEVDAAELVKALKRVPLALHPLERELAGANLSAAGGTLTLSGREGTAVEQIEYAGAWNEGDPPNDLPSDLMDGIVTCSLLRSVLATCSGFTRIGFGNKRLLISSKTDNIETTHVVVQRSHL